MAPSHIQNILDRLKGAKRSGRGWQAYCPARELQKDLLTAEIPLATPEGKLDFHCLRGTFITLVDKSIVSVKEGMSLARHSSPRLTFGVYAKTESDRLAEVVEKVAQALRPAQDYALCRTKKAAGAEGLDVIAINVKLLQATNNWRRGESNPRPRAFPQELLHA